MNEASVLRHKTFLRYRDEMSQLEAKVKELVEKRGMYKLFSEQHEGEIKSLRAELDAAQKEHADLLEQVQQKIDRVDQLQAEMDEVKAMAEEWKAITTRETLVKELEAARSEAETTRADAKEMMARYKADVEAAQERLKAIVEYVKWQSRREALEEVHARGFNLSAKLENIKRLKAEDKELAYPKDEEDSEGSDGSEDGEDSDGPGDEASSSEDQAS
nr:uncharacterized protein LOC104096026 [Nicotiana tomentosiformis]